MENPESIRIEVQSIYFKIVYKGMTLATMQSTERFIVPAKDSKDVVILSSINSLNAVNVIKDVISDGLNISVTIEGWIDTDYGRINLNFDQSFQI